MFQNNYYDGLTWYSNASPPDRIMLLEHSYSYAGKAGNLEAKLARALHGTEIAPIWTTLPKFMPSSHVAGNTSKFPPKWTTLCGVRFEHYFGYAVSVHIWNSEHPLLSYIDSDWLVWCQKMFSATLDPLPLRDEVLSNRSRASAWVILCMSGQLNELWDGLEIGTPHLFRLVDLVFPEIERSQTRK